MNTARSDSGPEMGDLIDRLVCGEIDEAARGRLLAWLEDEPTRWRLCGLAFLEREVWSHALGTWPEADGKGLAYGELSSHQTSRAEIPKTETRSASEGFSQRLTEMANTERGTGGTGVPRLRVGLESRASARSARLARLCYVAAMATSVLVAFGLGLVSRGVFFGSNGKSAPFVAGRPAVPGDQPLTPKNSVASRTSDVSPRNSGQPVLASITAHTGFGPAETAFQFPVVPANSTLAEAGDARPVVPDYVRQQWERRGFAVETQRRFLFATLPGGERVVGPVNSVQLNQLAIKVY